jgi:hypothetical protein
MPARVPRVRGGHTQAPRRAERAQDQGPPCPRDRESSLIGLAATPLESARRAQAQHGGSGKARADA